MLLLIALAGGTGAFAYAYAQLRRVRIDAVHRAETVARVVARAATAAARLIDLLADVLRLVTIPTADLPGGDAPRRLSTEPGPEEPFAEGDDW